MMLRHGVRKRGILFILASLLIVLFISACEAAKVEIDLSPIDDTNPVGTSHTVTLKVVVGGKPAAGAKVTFTVTSGPHAGLTFDTTTDAGGIAVFTYPGIKPGQDTIHATVAAGGAIWEAKPVTKTWLEKGPPTPTGARYLYPVKFVCGSIPASRSGPNQHAASEPPVKPGNYATAINIYNFQTSALKFTKKAAIANPQGEPTGAASSILTEEIGAGKALEVDCPNIAAMFSREERPGALPSFIKGFVEISSPAELQVVAVYTARGTKLSSTAAAQCTADPLPTTYPNPLLNTGWNNSPPSPALIANGQPDDDWDLINAPQGMPLGNAVVEDPYLSIAGTPLTPLPGSRWISLSDGTFMKNGTSTLSEATYGFQFKANPGCTATLDFNYLIQESPGLQPSTATFFLNGVPIAPPGGDPVVPTHVLTPALALSPTGSNTLTVVISKIVAIAPRLDVAGTVKFTPGAAGGESIPDGIAIDVEYIVPKIIKPTEEPPQGLDVALFKGHEGEFTLGGTGVYVVKVHANGITVSGIVVFDTLPLGVTFIANSQTPPWNCVVITPGTGTVQEVMECNYNAGLAANQTVTFMFKVNVNPLAGTPLGANCAEVKYPDINMANNKSCYVVPLKSTSATPLRLAPTAVAPAPTSTPTATPLRPTPTGTPMPTPTSMPAATTSTAVAPSSANRPDLAIEKFLNSQFLYGGRGSYSLLTRNDGSGPARSPIVVVDDLPGGLTFDSFSDPFSTNWACLVSGQRVTCTYTGPEIAPGGGLPTLILTVRIGSIAQFPAAGAAVQNCATVAHTDDRNRDNDTSCVTTPITATG